MEITYHPAKRDATLKERGLDFEDAAKVFAGPVLTMVDDRWDYGEDRFLTYGLASDRLVVVVWTPRGHACHVISMRHCNDRERAQFQHQLHRSR
jgi:hypothetical protein